MPAHDPPPLAGRSQEQLLLRERYADAAVRGQLVLLGGTAGIGKTALAEELCREARARGALVLTGRCYDLTETPPYGPWIDLFATYPRDDRYPPLTETVARCGTGGGVSSREELYAQVCAFLAALVAAAQGSRPPTILLLDDLHWSDRASLDLLRVVARRLGELPLLILATYRDDELPATASFAALLPLLVREGDAQRLALRPLTRDDIATLVHGRYRLPLSAFHRLVDYLWQYAEGHPFFTGELLHALEEEGLLRPGEPAWVLGDLAQIRMPLLVQQVIVRRLGRFDDEALRALGVAATLGQDVPLALWATVGELTDAALLGVVEQAIAARLLEELPGGQGVRFTHALIRHVLYSTSSPMRRRLWHRRAGATLLATGTPDPDAVAYHFRSAGDPRAGAWLIEAGARAQRTFGWVTAAQRFEEALALPDATAIAEHERGWLRLRVARVLRYIDTRRGLDQLAEAARIAEQTGDRALAASAQVQSGLLNCLTGAIARGLTALRAGTAALAALGDTDRARLVALAPVAGMMPDPHYERGMFALWLALSGHYDEAIERALPYRAVSLDTYSRPPSSSSNVADAYTALGLAYSARGQLAAAREAWRCARAAYGAVAHHANAVQIALREMQYLVLPFSADRDDERQRLRAIAAQEWVVGRGMYGEGEATMLQLPHFIFAEEWPPSYTEELVLRTRSASLLRAWAVEWLCPVVYAQGDTALARSLIADWLPAGPQATPGGSHYLFSMLLQRLAAALARDAGDHDAARAWLVAHDRWQEWGGAVVGRPEGQLEWAALHRARGDADAARDAAGRALTLADAPRQPLALVAAHRFLGELATAAGEHTRARELLDRALELALSCRSPYEQGLTLLALAALRATRADRAAALAALEEARALLTPLGVAPALARLDHLAQILRGERVLSSVAGQARRALPPLREAVAPHDDVRQPTALPHPALAALTDRQYEILRLIGAGQTNQQIAAFLSISEKTVERHVTNILRKLRLTNRIAAAVLAQRAGLVGGGEGDKLA